MASEKTRSLCLPTKSRSVATCDGSGFVAVASMAVEAGTLEKGEGGGALGAMRRMANQRSRSDDGEPEIAIGGWRTRDRDRRRRGGDGEPEIANQRSR
ncbi:hypothetical protein U1Q18_048430 [Sarracenia purpurea var. burkii]